jgi:branched-chain amino acid transport system substrate-binding protein
MKSIAALATLALVISCLALVSSAMEGAAAADAPYEINVVLSLTGPGAFLGSKEAQALAIEENLLNRSGGIHGRPVKFVIQDDATVPANAVQLVNGLLAKNVPIVIGSSVVATCSAMLPLVGKTGPVTYCLAPPVEAPPGSYLLTQGSLAADWLTVTFRALRSHGWNRVAVITATDASGQAYDRDLDAALAGSEGHGLTVVDREHFNPSDISMAAQVARMKAATPQAILTFTVGPSFGTLLKQLNDAGMNVPIFGSGGNINYAQLQSYGAFAPKELYFVANGGAALDPNAPRAVKAAQATFFNAFKDAGVRPEFLHTVAWDPAMLFVQALNAVGVDATARQIRDYISNLGVWGGVVGTYDFRANPQRGVGPSSVVMYRWDAGKSELTTVPVPNVR